MKRAQFSFFHLYNIREFKGLEMTKTKKKDHTGHSDDSINDAVTNALEHAGEHSWFEVIETRSTQQGEEIPPYQVTLTTHDH